MSVKTTKSVSYLELHIKDLEKNTRDLKLKVSHFDLDSVNLTCMLSMLSERFNKDGDPEGFFTGCADNNAESFWQIQP